MLSALTNNTGKLIRELDLSPKVPAQTNCVNPIRSMPYLLGQSDAGFFFVYSHGVQGVGDVVVDVLLLGPAFRLGALLFYEIC